MRGPLRLARHLREIARAEGGGAAHEVVKRRTTHERDHLPISRRHEPLDAFAQIHLELSAARGVVGTGRLGRPRLYHVKLAAVYDTPWSRQRA